LITDWTAGHLRPPARCDPHLPSLVELAERNFIWGTTIGIMQHFASYVFPGFAVQALIDAAVGADSGLSVQGCSVVGKFVAMRKHHASRPPEMRVNISILAQIMEVKQSIKGDHDDPATCSDVQCWVKEELLSCVRACHIGLRSFRMAAS
jgi:hypothetical protein